MAQSQVNVRLDSRKLETLEAAAFVDGRSVGDLIRAAVEDLADRLEDVTAVRLAIQARDERQRTPQPTVVGFPTKHRAGRASSG
jgi:Ribbon-helix-helix protein, copG family